MELNATLFRFSLLLLFVPVSVGAGIGFVVTLLGLRRRKELAAWVLVQARVRSMSVEHSEYRGVMGTKQTAWDLLVDYEYELSGKLYSAQVSLEVDVPGGGRADPDVVDNAVTLAKRKFENGFELRVNPADPSTSVIALEDSRWAYFRLIMFGLAVGVSLVVLAFIFSS